MPTRTADAEWKGDLLHGTGEIKLGSGTLTAPYDWRGRSADGAGTNPEELIGAAHAGCFSMQLAAMLTQAGAPPTRLHTTAKVHLEKADEGFAIPRIELTTEAVIPGMEDAAFQAHAAAAKAHCPVSKALAGVDIHLTATLVSE